MENDNEKLQVEVTPQQINDYLANQILKSQIGTVLQKEIKDAVEQLSNSYKNPFKSIIAEHIDKHIRQALDTIFQDEINEQCQAAIKKYVTNEVIGEIVTAGIRNLKDRY